jgi:hypothetical protein
MTKSWVHISVVNLLLVAVMTKLRAVIDHYVPMGYQDDAGFHFGVKPASGQKPL